MLHPRAALADFENLAATYPGVRVVKLYDAGHVLTIHVEEHDPLFDRGAFQDAIDRIRPMGLRVLYRYGDYGDNVAQIIADTIDNFSGLLSARVSDEKGTILIDIEEKSEEFDFDKFSELVKGVVPIGRLSDVSITLPTSPIEHISFTVQLTEWEGGYDPDMPDSALTQLLKKERE